MYIEVNSSGLLGFYPSNSEIRAVKVYCQIFEFYKYTRTTGGFTNTYPAEMNFE